MEKEVQATPESTADVGLWGETGEEFACGGDIGQGWVYAALDLIDVEEVDTATGHWEQLAGEGGLARAIGASNDDRDEGRG